MNTKEKFKDFVRKHPELISYVKDGKMTWQGFYEIYDMYGDDNKVWKDFISVATVSSIPSSFDVIDFIRNIDLDGLEEGINSIQRVLGLLQDMVPKENVSDNVRRPRPLYRHFED